MRPVKWFGRLRGFCGEKFEVFNLHFNAYIRADYRRGEGKVCFCHPPGWWDREADGGTAIYLHFYFHYIFLLSLLPISNFFTRLNCDLLFHPS